MDKLSYEEVGRLLEASHPVSELDYMISRIDALQAELWRRSQVEKDENDKPNFQKKAW